MKETINNNVNCQHVFKRIVSGPKLIVDFCPYCKLEIVDMISDSKFRVEVDKKGKLINYNYYNYDNN